MLSYRKVVKCLAVDEPYKLPGVAMIYTYHIKASYKTRSGNKKERLFSIKSSCKSLAIEYFYVQIATHNEKVPHNPFLDIEVLSCTERQKHVLNIDLKTDIVSYQSL